MLDRSYYQLRKYLAANFKCDLGVPTIKTALEALDACNFIAAYQEIGKMISKKSQNAVIANMAVQDDPVMEIKLRACKCVIAITEVDSDIMAYAVTKNLDFACCSRSSYGDCLIGLFANMVPADYDHLILERMIKLSKAIYRTDYNLDRIREEFPEDFYFMEQYMENDIEKDKKRKIEKQTEKNRKKDGEEEKAKDKIKDREDGFLKKVQKDAKVLENEWIF